MNFKIQLPQPSKVPTNVVDFHNSSSNPPPPIFSNRCIKIIRHKRIIKALNGYHFSRAIKMNSLPRLRIAITLSPLHSAYERGKKASGCDACLTACCNSVCTTTRRKKGKEEISLYSRVFITLLPYSFSDTPPFLSRFLSRLRRQSASCMLFRAKEKLCQLESA